MVYKTKRCPYCKMIYQYHSTNNYKYGSPILTCSFCKLEFVDKDVEELALKPFDTSQYTIGRCFWAAVWPVGLTALFFIVLAIICKEAWTIVAAVLGVAGYVALVIFYIKDLKNERWQYEREYKKSEERLKNKEYAHILRDLGYDVPTKYL